MNAYAKQRRARAELFVAELTKIRRQGNVADWVVTFTTGAKLVICVHAMCSKTGVLDELTRRLKKQTAQGIAESTCKHCGAVIDFISASWVKRETDGIYCSENRLELDKLGRHEARA